MSIFKWFTLIRFRIKINESLISADPEYKEVVVSTEVFVTDIGNVTWLAFAIFKSSCKVNVRYYPFDDQVTIQVASYILMFNKKCFKTGV